MYIIQCVCLRAHMHMYKGIHLRVLSVCGCCNALEYAVCQYIPTSVYLKEGIQSSYQPESYTRSNCSLTCTYIQCLQAL